MKMQLTEQLDHTFAVVIHWTAVYIIRSHVYLPNGALFSHRRTHPVISLATQLIYWSYKLLKDKYVVRSSILHQEEVDAMAQHVKFSDHHGG